MPSKPQFVGKRELVKLSEIAKIKAGNVAPKKDAFTEEGIPFVRAGSLTNLLAGESLADLEKIDDGTAQKLRLTLFPAGTVVFAKSGMSCMTGNVYVLPKPCYVVSHLACVIPNGNYASYLKHYFRFNRPNRLIENPSFPSIKLSKIQGIEFRLPSLEESVMQVQALERIESQIEKAKALLTHLNSLVKSRFVEMFGDPVNSNKWPRYKIGDVYAVKSSKRIYAKKQTRTGIPFYRLADINTLIDNGHANSKIYISEDTYAELASNDQVPLSGDILVTARGTLGRCYVIAPSDCFYFQDGMITWLSRKEVSPLPTYLVSVFKNAHFIDSLRASCSGTTVRYLSIFDLANTTIPLPPIALQEEFVDFVSCADKSRFISISRYRDILIKRMDADIHTYKALIDRDSPN